MKDEPYETKQHPTDPMKDGGFKYETKQHSNDVVFPRRPHFTFVFLGICVNSIMSVILVYSLNALVLPSALSDAAGSSVSRTASLHLSHLQELENLLDCDEAHWDECLQRASQFADSRQVYAQQIATHRSEVLKRALSGPTEYADIRVFPNQDQHPSLVPLDPKYTPSQEWDTDRAFPDISIAGLPKAGSTQMHTILKNHADAVQYGKSKEECASNGDYRYDFEDWDDVPILENRTKVSDAQLLVQRELFKYYKKLFSKKRPSGILDPSKRKTVNACYWINDIEISYHYLQPSKGKKAIFLFRDPADWYVCPALHLSFRPLLSF
jgi:hypothetical protein